MVRRRKVATTVYIRPDQDEALKALAAELGEPAAGLIRNGIDLVLRKHLGPVWRVAIGPSGEPEGVG